MSFDVNGVLSRGYTHTAAAGADQSLRDYNQEALFETLISLIEGMLSGSGSPAVSEPDWGIQQSSTWNQASPNAVAPDLSQLKFPSTFDCSVTATPAPASVTPAPASLPVSVSPAAVETVATQPVPAPTPSPSVPVTKPNGVVREALLASRGASSNMALDSLLNPRFLGGRSGASATPNQEAKLIVEKSGLNPKNITINGSYILLVDSTGQQRKVTAKDLAEHGTLQYDGKEVPATEANIKEAVKKKMPSATGYNFKQLLSTFFTKYPEGVICYKVDDSESLPSSSSSSSSSYSSAESIASQSSACTIFKITCMLFNWSPLTVDMNGDGLNLTSDPSVNRNGKQTSWVGQDNKDDVFIVKNLHNGQVELFGENTDASDGDNGFTQLRREFDQNQDGVFDRQDAAYGNGDVMAWHDKNGDAVIDDGELTSLADKGIAKVNLGFKKSDEVVNFNLVPYQSSVELTDGQTRTVYDVLFNSQNQP